MKRAGLIFKRAFLRKQDEGVLAPPFYLEKYPVFVRILRPACFGRITIFRNVSSLPEFVG
jgi:hypothetical protein